MKFLPIALVNQPPSQQKMHKGFQACLKIRAFTAHTAGLQLQ